MAKKLRLLIYGVLLIYSGLLLSLQIYAVQKGQIILVGRFQEDFFWLLFIAAWTIAAIVALIRYKMKRNTRHPILVTILVIVGVIVMTLFLLLTSFLIWFIHVEDTYNTFQSPDGKHIIVTCERSILMFGEVCLYEKTGPLLVEYETALPAGDGREPITNGDYQIEWLDDKVIFSVLHYAGERIAYGPNQWAKPWWTAEIKLGVSGSNVHKYETYEYEDGSLHTEDEITYIPPDNEDLSD